jgi:hypothetical protein
MHSVGNGVSCRTWRRYLHVAKNFDRLIDPYRGPILRVNLGPLQGAPGQGDGPEPGQSFNSSPTMGETMACGRAGLI